MKTDNGRAKAKVHRIVTDCAVDFLATYATHVKPHAGSATELVKVASSTQSVGAVVTFSGTNIRGSLAVLSAFDFLAGCLQRGDTPLRLPHERVQDWSFVRDFAKETANQILGRIKNRLASCGVGLEARTPTALCGQVAKGMIMTRSRNPLVFAVGLQPVFVLWFDYSASNETNQSILDGSAVPALCEGDVALF